MEQLSKQVTGSISLIKRILTGIILVILIILMVIIGPVGFLVLVVAINQLALMEYHRLVKLTNSTVQWITTQVTGGLLILISWLVMQQYGSPSLFLLFMVCPVIILAIELFSGSNRSFQNAGVTALGILWISLPMALFLISGYLPWDQGNYHPALILGYFVILWLGDSGAYFTGKLTGRHKLFHRISPKKTWEGSIGGLALAWVAGLINFHLFGVLELSQWLVLALIINLSGTFGDFTKSMLKRNAGVKDSSAILPGHGGILDRFDSLIGSAPFVFLYLILYA